MADESSKSVAQISRELGLRPNQIVKKQSRKALFPAKVNRQVKTPRSDA